MIEANINESFPVSVTLLDEELAQLVSGQMVTYDIRNFDDSVLVPPVSGTLLESTVEGGIYRTHVSLSMEGNYVCYVSSDGFFSSSEDIVINGESCVDVAKYNLPHNISVLNVQRTSVSGTTSQLNRNVAVGDTDYVVTFIKRDTDSDWSDPVASGVNYMWYESLEASLPYMIGSEY